MSGLTCPYCKAAIDIKALLKPLSKQEKKSIIGALTASMREVRGAGPGRPKITERCACGAMSLKRAKARNHKCEKNI